MKAEFTEAQKALRAEIRSYLETEIMSDALRDELAGAVGEGGGPLFFEALRKMGADGWIGVGWPEELGGRGMSPIEQFIFVEEIMRAGYPFPFLTTESVGPQLAAVGNDWQKQEIVPRILRGECLVAIGYSEPGAGTDLANLKTKAVRDGDDWVISGQKIFTSLVNFCDYVWLAVRTDDTCEKKHKGISVFLVPTDAPGFSLTPIHTLGGVRTNATYYDNVRVPAEALVGELNGGWKLVTGQLNRERLSLVNFGPSAVLFNEVVQWAGDQALADGKRLLAEPWVQLNLARVRANIESLKLVCYKQAWAMTEGALDMADASAAKVFGSESMIENFRLLAEVLGAAGVVNRQSPTGAVLRGRLENLYRTASIITFGGGTNEIQRDIISAAGLWMPRAAR